MAKEIQKRNINQRYENQRVTFVLHGLAKSNDRIKHIVGKDRQINTRCTVDICREKFHNVYQNRVINSNPGCCF
jgi:hypothetical protein